METLQGKLEALLTRELQDGETDLETLPNGHVCGHVISPEFQGKSYEERRRRIKEIIDPNLDRSELASVSTLLTYTLEEWSYEPEKS